GRLLPHHVDTLGRKGKSIGETADLCCRLQLHALYGKDVDAERSVLPKARKHFLGRQDLVQLEFRNLLAADDAERQRQREDDARMRMKGLGVGKGKGGTTQHALEAAQQVVVAEQTKVAALGETETELVLDNRSRPPRSGDIHPLGRGSPGVGGRGKSVSR